jgi:heavy metal sensor kinase
MIKVRSIRFRLTVWHACLLTAAFVLLGVLLFMQLKNTLQNALLDTQAHRAHQIAETLLSPINRTGEKYVVAEIEILYAPEHSDRFIRITRKDGSMLYVSGPPNDQSFDPGDVPPAVPSTQREFTRKQVMADGRALLIAACRATTENGESYLVEVGTSATPIDTMLSHLLLLLGLSLPVVVLVAVGGGYLLVRRALTPVEEIARKAQIITQHNLSERLPVALTGDELERLSVSLNHMIARLESALQNSKRFVADASHELRTPMTILRGELENLAQDFQLPTALQERLGSLLEEVERLSKIVERLFALSRLDAGEAHAECVRFDLAELTATTAEQMVLLAEDKKISVTCDAEQAVPVKGDRARLKQVVVNLLDNAIKYTPNGGTVHLKIAAANNHALIEISDTGIGISAEALPHVFDRFFRVDQARSRTPDGAGLGLAIVHSICHAHGGNVTAESVIGKGSRFCVTLPLAERENSTGKIT